MRILVLAFVMIVCSAPVWAQSSDVRGLYDRIDRLERDLQTLQSQLARGGTSSLVVTSPSAQSQGGGRVSAASAGLSDRMDSLEDQLRDLTGKVEEANHHAQQVGTKLEHLQADLELRFKDLDGQMHPNGAAAASPDTAVADAGGKKPVPPNNSAENPGLAPGPQVLGTISDKDIKKAGTAAAAAPAAAPKDPKAAYDAAYALFQSNDYAGSADAFHAFLTRFPEHQLAAGAYFWQGESVYAQKDYKTALTIFAEGYKKYPNSGKSADLLFKMGQSFGQLNMAKQACSAYRLLFEDHKDMPDRLRKAATADKVKLGC